MKLENNFVQVKNDPSVINEVNSVAAAFGWTVQSIQITDSSVAYESGAVGWTTEFGTFVNKTISIKRNTYASITYQRDMEDRAYQEWVALENEYNEIEKRSYLSEEDKEIVRSIEENVKEKYRKIFIVVVALSVVTLNIFSGILCVWAYVKREALVIRKVMKSSQYIEIKSRANQKKETAKQAVLDRARSL